VNPQEYGATPQATGRRMRPAMSGNSAILSSAALAGRSVPGGTREQPYRPAPAIVSHYRKQGATANGRLSTLAEDRLLARLAPNTIGIWRDRL
jgi:hypothetical protein